MNGIDFERESYSSLCKLSGLPDTDIPKKKNGFLGNKFRTVGIELMYVK